MKAHQIVIPSLILAVFLQIDFARAEQGDEDSSINEVESIFDKDSEKEEAVPAPSKEDTVSGGEVSALKNLQPFSDIAVIQRKFLPKTKRFEAYGSLNAVVNNAFFLDFGIVGRFAYHFNEALGIEAVIMALTSSNRDVTNDLQNLRNINTNGLVAPSMYYGGLAIWTPVYGKMALFDNHIVPFDMYFGVGGGITSTNQHESALTFEVSTGQRFAISKKMAFRWDFSWNFYSASYTINNVKSTGNFDNLFLAVGMTFFFPEATYR